MKPCLHACSIALLSLSLLPSCALREQLAVRFEKLQPGGTYEVRRAMAATAAFHPNQLNSYFFVVDAPRPRPPMAAAVRPSLPLPSYVAVAGDPVPGVRTTAYCHDESDHLQYGHFNAIGTFLKYGAVRSAAADWSRYPVGTRFRIASEPGVIYEVDDYGSALIGTNTIDLYRPTQTQMNAWGVRNVDIEVVEWGSFERSRQYLEGRTHYPHVRQMFQDIQRRLNTQPPVSTSITPVTAMTEPSTVTAPGFSPSI